MSPGRGGLEPDAVTALAADAYVYGSPLVRQLSAVQACLHEGSGMLAPAPFNDFAHADGPATPGTHVPYAPADLVDALAQLDLSGGPVRLHVPDTGGAYYVLQFVDAWGNAFAYLGPRATGTGEGDWLVVPPGWAGTVPDGLSGVIDAPTSVVSVVGRLACDGPEDLPRVRALQQELTLTHLGDRAHRTGLPATEPGVPGELRFFEELRVWMADFPPASADRAYQDRFQPLGLLEEGISPYVSAGPGLVRALGRGLALGRLRVEEAPARRAGHRAPGGRFRTCATTTWTTSASARSGDRNGRSPTVRPPTWSGRWPRGRGAGCPTGTRRCTRTRRATPAATRSTASTPTSCASPRRHRCGRSGR